jgi:hypothetical protein
VTPEAFLGFARDYYRKIFGQNLRGEARFERDGEGIKHRQAESAYLTKIVEGVKIGGSSFTIRKTGDGGYSLSCSMGRGEVEAARVKSYLAAHSMNFTQRDAMSLVQCQTQKTNHERLEGSSLHFDKIFWGNPCSRWGRSPRGGRWRGGLPIRQVSERGRRASEGSWR